MKAGKKNYIVDDALINTLNSLIQKGYSLRAIHRQSGIDIGYNRFWHVVNRHEYTDKAGKVVKMSNGGLSEKNKAKLWRFVGEL